MKHEMVKMLSSEFDMARFGICKEAGPLQVGPWLQSHWLSAKHKSTPSISLEWYGMDDLGSCNSDPSMLQVPIVATRYLSKPLIGLQSGLTCHVNPAYTWIDDEGRRKVVVTFVGRCDGDKSCVAGVVFFYLQVSVVRNSLIREPKLMST